jgi:hypothetical protein
VARARPSSTSGKWGRVYFFQFTLTTRQGKHGARFVLAVGLRTASRAFLRAIAETILHSAGRVEEASKADLNTAEPIAGGGVSAGLWSREPAVSGITRGFDSAPPSCVAFLCN